MMFILAAINNNQACLINRPRKEQSISFIGINNAIQKNDIDWLSHILFLLSLSNSLP